MRHEDQEKEVRIMNRTAQNKMKFDTRLQGRRGWVDPKELEDAIGSLEDSAGNLAEDEADSMEAAPEANQEPS